MPRRTLELAHVVAAVEQLYAERAATMQAWSVALVPALRPLFVRPGRVGVITMRIASSELLAIAHEPHFMGSTVPPGLAEFFLRSSLGSQFLRTPHPVGLRSSMGPLSQDVYAAMQERDGADELGLLGRPEPDVGVAAYVVIPESAPPTPRERALLTRLTLHLEAAVRLRLRPDAVLGYVTPAGRVELSAELPESVRPSTLGATAQGIDRVRTRAQRDDGEHALRVWPALVSGRVSLAERVDSDGKRLYDLCANAPRHEALRALSERESAVVHECARGLANKEVAYALGLSQPAVSHALASAAQKLGVRSARALVRLASGLRGVGGAVANLEKLSAAERAVLALVAQGKSNAQIARERRSTPRTVANQIAAVFKKTGARTRRELAIGSSASSPLPAAHETYEEGPSSASPRSDR